MKGDFSRDTFDRSKHFSRVLMQQGRVQLDADWNEQAAILLHYLRTLAADLIGPFAGPGGADQGFEIIIDEKKGGDFKIGKGRYYVDGILCENDHSDLTFTTQNDYPGASLPVRLDGAYLVYLDVWERHVTALEDDSIREKALGGPDTASRSKIVWQVKVESNLPDDLKVPNQGDHPNRDRVLGQVVTQWPDLLKFWQPNHLACLRVQVDRASKSNDPCLIPPDSKYRGPENQLYRIEIHRGDRIGPDGQDNAPTFKWSRENGSVVSLGSLSGEKLTVLNSRGFHANNWVELTNNALELRGEPGTLVKVINVEADVLTLASAPTIANGENWPCKVRRWDQVEKPGKALVDGAVPISEGSGEMGWIDLEEGIKIQFMIANGSDKEVKYRTGDYWLVPARVATGDIEWPVELNDDGTPVLDDEGHSNPLPRPPHGIFHHYAPLAILSVKDNGITGVEDLRCKFRASNEFNIESAGIAGIGGYLSCNNEAGKDET